MMSFRDKDIAYATKQEDEDLNKVTTVVPSSSRQWSGFKNPRIVRVSRTFGGKDRHSKVCTVKGLRDRRIRLSVPTAIQLYDLQDRLGLNQPSKVIDWLLDTTKHDIDKLPPLPNIPGIFNSFQGYGAPMTSSSNSTSFLDANLLALSRREDINVNSSHRTVDDNEDAHSLVAKLKFWESMRSKQGEIDSTTSCSSQVYAQNLFPIARGNSNTSSVLPPNPSLLSNDHMFNNYYHWEPSSNLSLAQFGTLGLPSQNDNSNPNSLPSSLSLGASDSRLFMSPTTPVFPTHTSLMNNSNRHEVENELRQFNHFDHSSGLGLGPFPFTMTRDHDQPHNLHQNDESNREKGN